MVFVGKGRRVLVCAAEILSLLPSEGSEGGEAPETCDVRAVKAENCSTCELPCEPERNKNKRYIS